MATTTTCDICGVEAVDRIEIASKTTTTIKMDVCVDHLAEFKKLVRVFTKQEMELVQSK